MVVGPGCARCKATFELVKKVVEKEKLNVELEYVTDMNEAFKLGVVVTPAVVVDGKVVVQGKIPKESEILSFIRK